MTGISPEQEALYALAWNMPRSDLSMTAQLEYDRLRPAWERGEARPAEEREAARLAWEQKHPPDAGERRGSWLVTRPGRYARLVTGDEVRDMMFLPSGGYDVAEVDDLLRRVATELDAGRPAGPLIRNATFREQPNGGYDVAAVDWFLGQLLFRPGPAELAGMGADPWRDLGVAAQVTRSGVGDLPGRSARQSRRALQKYYSEKCSEAWDGFGQHPGVNLRLEWAGAAHRELRTMEPQTIASISYPRSDMLLSFIKNSGFSLLDYDSSITVSTSERSFVLTKTDTARSSYPGIAEIAAPASPDFKGHFAADTNSTHSRKALRLRELVDETGIPILYTSGRNYDHRARASILFPDQRWLRFWIRGTGRADAIMTAVDEAGNSVVRYRIIYSSSRNIVEIIVHPGWELTEELVLAIAISAPWLSPYFSVSGGGGG
jgi:DivIVA domain-containing protein